MTESRTFDAFASEGVLAAQRELENGVRARGAVVHVRGGGATILRGLLKQRKHGVGRFHWHYSMSKRRRTEWGKPSIKTMQASNLCNSYQS